MTVGPVESPWTKLRDEMPPMLKLALPVVAAELGWMSMGFVDTLMVGRLGPEAIGATGVGNHFFFCIAVFGIGLLLGLDTLISQSWGAGNREDCKHSLRQGLWLALMIVPFAWLVMQLLAATLGGWGFERGVSDLATPYLRTSSWSVLPLLIYAVFRRYLQATGVVRPVTVAIVSANLVNVLGNWLLIYGNWGFPQLGVVGSAWATFWSRAYVAVFLLVVLLRREDSGLFRVEAVDWARVRRLLELGVPAASQILLEIGVFAAASVLAGQFPAVYLAAHEIVLNTASLTFMVPLGIAAAGSVRVGHAIGRGDPDGARIAGWTAISLGAAFMAAAGVAMVSIPSRIIGVYTTEAAVVAIGIPLLFAAAAFQLFDGIQAVTIGVLRGAGDTRTALLANIAGFWVLGLPVGAWLCFTMGFRVLGLWIGLAIGLLLVATILLWKWRNFRLSRATL